LKEIAYIEMCKSPENINTEFLEFIVGMDMSLDQYCQKMQESIDNPQKTFWGDNFVLAALSKIMKITFKIVKQNKQNMTWYTIDDGMPGNNPIVLLHYVNMNHYNVIVPSPGPVELQ